MRIGAKNAKLACFFSSLGKMSGGGKLLLGDFLDFVNFVMLR